MIRRQALPCIRPQARAPRVNSTMVSGRGSQVWDLRSGSQVGAEPVIGPFVSKCRGKKGRRAGPDCRQGLVAGIGRLCRTHIEPDPFAGHTQDTRSTHRITAIAPVPDKLGANPFERLRYDRHHSRRNVPGTWGGLVPLPRTNTKRPAFRARRSLDWKSAISSAAKSAGRGRPGLRQGGLPVGPILF